MEVAGGVGGTEVWYADFDHNGWNDLLISSLFPQNGRCSQRATLYTLMFDDSGRPVPWVTASSAFTGFEKPPTPLLNVANSGRATMVTLDCEYADQLNTGFSVDLSLSGVYEARNARWVPLRGVSTEPYLKAAKDRIGEQRPDYAHWEEPDPQKWPDFLSGFDQQPELRLKSLLTGTEGCQHAVWLPIVNGRIVKDLRDPCEEIRYPRIVLSDGSTRRGWPAVVIDSPSGRDIYLNDTPRQLMNLIRAGYKLKVLGDPKAPDLLWADTKAGTQPVLVSCHLQIDSDPGFNVPFEPPAGTKPTIELDLPLTYGRLVEWRSGTNKWLVLNAPDGKPLSTPMSLPAGWDLVGSSGTEGFHFRRQGDTVTMPGAVECSRAE